MKAAFAPGGAALALLLPTVLTDGRPPVLYERAFEGFLGLYLLSVPLMALLTFVGAATLSCRGQRAEGARRAIIVVLMGLGWGGSLVFLSFMLVFSSFVWGR